MQQIKSCYLCFKLSSVLKWTPQQHFSLNLEKRGDVVFLFQDNLFYRIMSQSIASETNVHVFIHFILISL